MPQGSRLSQGMRGMDLAGLEPRAREPPNSRLWKRAQRTFGPGPGRQAEAEVRVAPDTERRTHAACRASFSGQSSTFSRAFVVCCGLESA
eukprot:15462274-Alexandrium_andersonii.AAC.1